MAIKDQALTRPSLLLSPIDRHHYTLGIHALWPELAALRCPGLYWLLADRPAQADALILGMLAGAAVEDQIDWIAADGHARQTASRLDAHQGPGQLSFFALPASLSAGAWLALPESLSRMRRRRRQGPRLVLLQIPGLAFDRSLDDAQLAAWCRRWSTWATHRNCCVVVISHGPGGLSLRGRLQPHNDTLDGLAHLQLVGEEGRFLVVHWRNDLGVCGGCDLALTFDEPGWRLLRLQTRSQAQGEASGSDEHEYLAQRNVLQGAPPLSEHWHVYETAREVVAQAASARAASVILGVERSDDIEEVARCVHDLRLQRGNALKLVVRALSPCLRYRDERLLFLCGVTLITGHGVSLSRFLSRLEGIQGQRQARRVLDDFEAISASLRPVTSGGILSPATFITGIEQWLDSSAPGAISSLLVLLQPAGGLSLTQALEQCGLSRRGDMATLMDGRLYLFLFGCRTTELEAALERLFGLPDNALFASCEVFDSREQIGAEQHRLIEMGWNAVTEIEYVAPSSAVRQTGMDVTQRSTSRPHPAVLRLKSSAASGDQP